jgi:hypothetical protein
MYLSRQHLLEGIFIFIQHLEFINEKENKLVPAPNDYPILEKVYHQC